MIPVPGEVIEDRHQHPAFFAGLFGGDGSEADGQHAGPQFGGETHRAADGGHPLVDLLGIVQGPAGGKEGGGDGEPLLGQPVQKLFASRFAEQLGTQFFAQFKLHTGGATGGRPTKGQIQRLGEGPGRDSQGG